LKRGITVNIGHLTVEIWLNVQLKPVREKTVPNSHESAEKLTCLAWVLKAELTSKFKVAPLD